MKRGTGLCTAEGSKEYQESYTVHGGAPNSKYLVNRWLWFLNQTCHITMSADELFVLEIVKVDK